MNKRTEARIPQDLRDDADCLVNHLGHTSRNDVITKALRFYLDQFKTDIERIKKQAKRPRN